MNYASMGITPISFTIVQMSNPPLQCIFHVQCAMGIFTGVQCNVKLAKTKMQQGKLICNLWFYHIGDTHHLQQKSEILDWKKKEQGRH